MTSLQTWLGGVVFGLGVAIPIGPVNIEMARRALLRSWPAGVVLGLGAVSIDCVYAVVATLGAAAAKRLADAPLFHGILTFASVGLLAYLGIGAIVAARGAAKSGWNLEEAPATNTAVPRESLLRGYGTGLLMTLVNPMTLVFWFISLPGQFLTLGFERGQLPFFVIGVFAGTCSWVLVFSSLMALVGRWRKPWWMALADLIGGIVLLYYAGATVAREGRRLGVW